MRRHHHLLPTHIYTILIRCNEIKGSKNISTLKIIKKNGAQNIKITHKIYYYLSAVEKQISDNIIR